ncbi:hypothetical protein HY498_01095 [Candidatus Woesearchaeota archaeon]|nr:hypothetical protein [Candidatus Woesearchaeota archaeon]
MVKEIIKNNKKLYRCEECGFNYSDKKLAERCQEWCNKHHSCSLEITKHAVH